MTCRCHCSTNSSNPKYEMPVTKNTSTVLAALALVCFPLGVGLISSLAMLLVTALCAMGTLLLLLFMLVAAAATSACYILWAISANAGLREEPNRPIIPHTLPCPAENSCTEKSSEGQRCSSSASGDSQPSLDEEVREMCCASSLLSMEKGGYEICRFDSGSEPVVTCIDDVEFIPYKELVPQDPAPPTAEPSPRMADHEAERSGQGGLHGMDGLCRASSSLYSKSSMVDPEVWHYESPSSASASARTTPVLLHQPAPIAQPSSLLFADSLALGLFGLQQFPASDSCPIYGYSSQGEASDPAAPAVPLPSIAATSAAADQRKSAFNFTETTHATVNDSDGNAFKLPDAGSAAFVKGNFRPFDFTLPPATTSKFTSVPSQRASTSTTTVASGSGGDQHGTFEPAHTTPNKESSIVQLLRKIIDGRRRGQQMDTYATMGIACTTT